MKRASFILALMLLVCLTTSALAASTDQLTGYQGKQKAWQYIEFGSYPTDADGTARPILWRVLSADGSQAYLLSEYILFAHRVDPNCYPVNKKTLQYGGWETSELFNYLNRDFLDTAFTESEQTALKANEDGGLVSLADIQDIKNKKFGFTSEKLRQAQSTAYAKANGLFVYQGAKKYSPYWLRSRSTSKQYAHQKVQDNGKVGYISVEVADVGARPVITLDLHKLTDLEGAGTQAEPYRAVLNTGEDKADEAAEAADPEAEDQADAEPEAPADEADQIGAAEPADETAEPTAPVSVEEAAEPEASEAAEKAAEPEETAAVRFESAHAAKFPPLTEEGFRPVGEPEFVLEDEEAGLWLYASQDVRVEIERKESRASKKRPWRWFEAELYARPGSDEFLRVFYHDNNPKSKKTVQISDIAAENHLVFSMNADWYYYRVLRNKGHKVMPVGIILRQGDVLYNDPAKKIWNTIPNRDILALYRDGNMEGYDYNGITADALVEKGAYDVLSFGPVLLNDGEITPQTVKISAKQQDNPRSGIGMVSPGHYVAIVMEGSSTISVGCTIKEFAELFQAKGCSVAYNLDGGGTASMMFMGKYLNKMGWYKANARKQVEALGLGISEQVHK